MKNNEEIIQHFFRNLEKTEPSYEFDQLNNSLENSETLMQEMNIAQGANNNNDLNSPMMWEEMEMQIFRRYAQDQSKVLKRRNLRYWWTSAASLLLIVGILVSIYMISELNEYVIYKTSDGQVEKIVLEDGSQVTLNANSELKWKKNWKTAWERMVILEGEAYFDVKSMLDKRTNKKMGFYVQTDGLTINVLGTSFNVKSKSEKTDVYLEEGRIELDFKESKNELSEDKFNEEMVMNPGESVSYSNRTKKMSRAKKAQLGETTLEKGTFMYLNQSVKDIFQSLEEIYGVEFQIHDEKLLNQKLTTNLPYSDWSIVQSVLELILKIQMEKHDDKIILTK